MVAAAAASLALVQPDIALAQTPDRPTPSPTDAPPPEERTPEAAPEGEPAPDVETAPEEPTTPAAEPAGEAAPTAPAASAPAPRATAPAPQPAAAGTTGLGQWPEPEQDAEDLEQQGEERPKEVDKNRVFAEDWWSHTRPTLELHGYFRVRAEMFYKFALGRIDNPVNAMWPRPSDDFYVDLNGAEYGPALCTPDEAGTGSSDDPADATEPCEDNTQAGANLRFRLAPELVISDNLRVRSQIDILDNLVLGSTPGGYANDVGDNGYVVAQRDGYTPISGDTTTQVTRVSSINGVEDSIAVKRAWAEYNTPVGQLRFGRMPDQWGLGMLYNAGDDPDGDWQSTVDRIAFTTSLQSLALYVGAAWDFANEIPNSASFSIAGSQPYDLGNKDDLSQYNLWLFRKVDPELERLYLAKGDLVLNGGLYLRYQTQRLANDTAGSCGAGAAALDCEPGQASQGYARRGLNVWTPDLWLELKYKKFKFEAEAASHLGTIQSTSTLPGDNNYENSDGDDGWDVNQWGLATRLSQLLVEDRLELKFDFGWASGDSDVEGLSPGRSGAQAQIGDRTISTFRFNPAYRVDLILNRNILTRVQGTYYFKPGVRYDFIRKATGLRLGGIAEAIWTRASSFMQTPGHERDLGIELDGTLYFQSMDGSLNDDPQKMGGFFTMLQYGVLFPLSGLGYQSDQVRAGGGSPPDLETAQILRLYLGVLF